MTSKNFTKQLRKFMQDHQDLQNAQTLDMMDSMNTLPLPQQRALIRETLQRHGTNCDLNDSDPTGDGDQSPIPTEEGRQAARELFASGGDIEGHVVLGALSNFAIDCISGNSEKVRVMLEESCSSDANDGRPPKKLVDLLETRETSMRLSPLLMMVSMGKNIQGGASFEREQAKVVRLLLQYGARPDAKDVVGKTVCHYGCGQMTTKMTLEAADMCIRAAKSAHLFGKDVELYGLSNEAMNGKRGIARGFHEETNRRAIFLIEKRKEVGVKPENIRLVGETSATRADQRPMLADIQDRLGSVCLHEVIMSQREDVAKFLLEDHGASIDPTDMDGISPRRMAMMGMGQAASSVSPLIMKAAIHQGRSEKKAQISRCGNCGVPESEPGTFKQCSKCKSVVYCSKKCQLEAWKAGHKQVCAAQARGILLEKPHDDGMYTMLLSHSSGKTTSNGSYRRPDGVDIDETFYIKVQAGGNDQVPLMVYDKTRQCCFGINPDQRGFLALYEKVRAETATRGTKSYFKASFNASNECTVYPASATLKKW